MSYKIIEYIFCIYKKYMYICTQITTSKKIEIMETVNFLKLDKALVLTNCKSEFDDSELSFDYEFNGVNVSIDICKYDNSVCVYASDNVCYTFSKMYNNLNHAINGLNLWLKNANYKR